MTGAPEISVVVCTFNRARLLRGCLDSLDEQTAPNTTFEVIVVDNNSTDETLGVCSERAKRRPNLRTVLEPLQGLSHARNRGIREARGQYVAYIDDDARAFPDWVEHMLSFARRRPDVGAYGGPYSAFSEVPPPKWFPRDYGILDLGTEERELDIGREWITGSNMVFRKALLLDMGGFNVELGMKGNEVAYGEEAQLLLGMKARGIPVYAVPAMRVEHLIADYKMSLRWLLMSRYRAGRGYVLQQGGPRSLWSHLRWSVWAAGRAVVRLLAGPGPARGRLYDALAPLAYETGAVVDYFTHRK